MVAAKSDADRTHLKRAIKATDKKTDALVYKMKKLSQSGADRPAVPPEGLHSTHPG